MSANALQHSGLEGDNPLLDDEKKNHPLAEAGSSSGTSSSSSSVRADDTNGDEDARAQLDLALNSDFDPSLFDYGWATEEPAGLGGSSSRNSQEGSSLVGERGEPITSAAPFNESDRATPSELGGYDMVEDSAAARETSNISGSGATTHKSATTPRGRSGGGTRNTVATAVSMSEASSITGASKSSASVGTGFQQHEAAPSLPGNTSGASSHPATTSSTSALDPAMQYASPLPLQQNPFTIQASANCPPNVFASLTAQGPSAAPSEANMNAANLFSPATLPLAFNALAAGANLPNHAPFCFWPHLPSQQQGLGTTSQGTVPPPSQAQSISSYTTASPAATVSVSGQKHKSGSSSAAPKVNQASDGSSLPPFLLFDAPIELRANFIKSQLAHGISPMQDNNSHHYRLVEHGSQTHPSRQVAGPANGAVRLIDGRHGSFGDKQLKNAREQKRTQKITDLIDQLRVKMERSGWKVGLKSKFHTLSSCAEYVKHLVQVNKEKEEALEKAKSDLAAKRRRIEEEKNTQQDPSDPESTTSSLTVSSGSANAKSCSEKDLSNFTPNNGNAEKQDTIVKKVRLNLHESSISSGGDDTGEAPQPGRQNVSFDHMVSSVSDITDSNKGSSSEGNSSSQRSTGYRSSTAGTDADDGPASSGSVSSDAAVAHSIGNQGQGTSLSDVVITGRKRKAVEIASDTNSFELDYEEVFLKSNVPQLLATTSGRIVAHNEFFLKATGLFEDELDRLTIFSLVKSNHLSSLFEIVAAALRTGSQQSDDEEKSLGQDVAKRNCNKSEQGGGGKFNYSAITLPCTTFRPRPGALMDKQMYITVTLMADADPRKRCFHCVFTDCQGTNGALGTISPDLVSLLFTEQHPMERTARAEPSRSNKEKTRRKRGTGTLNTE